MAGSHRSPHRFLTCAAACALLPGILLASAPARAQFQPLVPGPTRAVELELVLAVDTSSSVSPEEFDLQMRGYAGAFRDPSVLAAIAATGQAGIAVHMFQWSDNRRQAIAVDWRLLTDESSILAFAEEIDRTPRFLDGGGTAIGGAIEYGLSELERNGYEGGRRVIDISGDGRANQGAQPDSLRDLAVLAGVTVNGLAILNEDSSVASYYSNNVIGGEGAFVMTANDYESFAQAILEKLIKEIGGVPVVQAPREAPGAGPRQVQEAEAPPREGPREGRVPTAWDYHPPR
jgi:hypothetical protein